MSRAALFSQQCPSAGESSSDISPRPTPIDLNELLRFDSETGLLYWRERALKWFGNGGLRACASWNARYSGAPALTNITRKGYRKGRILGCSVLAHHVVFAMNYGRWPSGSIDHKDRDPSNNRLDNLREATQAQNCWNRRRRNTSGYIGVARRSNGKWAARFGKGTKRYHIGTFSDPVGAARARDAVARKIHGEYAILNFPVEINQ